MQKEGSVTLVGAGCGKDLITVKGLLALEKADVVIYDDLIDQGLLLKTRRDCEKVYVGKRSGKHSKSQEEINVLLVKKAKEGKQVIRLKGGDSFVFGRGGEELLFLQKEGIPYDVVPGVTSGIAVPGHAGIPVTHRGVAQSVTIVTGHSASGEEEDYQALAKLKGTLVFLMGLGRIREITEKLMAKGKAEDTPAAIISNGFTAKEKRIDGTLSDIAGKAKLAQTPAVLVVGQTAGLTLARTLRGELEGISVTVTGTERFVGKMGKRLGELGAETDCRPCLRVIPDYEKIPASLEVFGWLVFTSANGVEVFFEGLSRRRIDVRRLSRLKFACIGPGTADKLGEYGIYADLLPDVYRAAKLGEALASKVAAGEKALILRAKDGSPELRAELDKGRVFFEDIAIYHTEPVAEGSGSFCAGTDYIIFGSAHGVESFLQNGDFSDRTTPVCMGPVTAEALGKMRKGTRAAGKEAAEEAVCLIPEQYTVEGVVETIIKDSRRKEMRFDRE